MSAFLLMWVIYHGMKDRPGPYTVRRWEVGPGVLVATGDARDALTLAEARALVPEDTVCLPRHPDDDPVIVEAWV